MRCGLVFLSALTYWIFGTVYRFRLAAARKPRPGAFRVPTKGEKKQENIVCHNHDPDAPDALVLYRAPKFDKYVVFPQLLA